MPQLQDRVAIVTGASTGIGQAIARAFAAEGARVAIAARARDKLDAFAAELRAKGQRVLPVPTDVMSEESVLALFARTAEEFGRLDILVNNAGTNAVSPTDELSLADWNRVIGTNLTGAFLCTRQAMKLMKRQKAGRIINIGSVSARVSRIHQAAYTTSKFGLDGLTKATALEGREHGIAVSILHPGNTETAIWAGREQVARTEGIMDADELARIAVLMAALPPGMYMLEAVALPVTMPFLGRG
jgi:NAD(P)-dependent dehydrogenase (short-subunit alcohol dehydrogenase family)